MDGNQVQDTPEQDSPDQAEGVPITSEKAQQSLDQQTINQALMNSRAELAQAKILHRMVEQGVGPEMPHNTGHANQIADDVKKLLRRVALLVELSAECEASPGGIAPPARATTELVIPTPKVPTELSGGRDL